MAAMVSLGNNQNEMEDMEEFEIDVPNLFTLYLGFFIKFSEFKDFNF